MLSPRSLPPARAAALVLFVALPAFAQSHHSKIDRSLQDSLRTGAATERVIVTVDDPALRSAIRQSLLTHGDVIKGNSAAGLTKSR